MDTSMTRHIHSDTEQNTPKTRESVLRAGRVSPRGMHEAKHGADASCSPPTVVAARTLPAAGLSPSGWPAGRTRYDGCSTSFKRVRTRCGAKASGDL